VARPIAVRGPFVGAQPNHFVSKRQFQPAIAVRVEASGQFEAHRQLSTIA
jgi:hypothetical protein